MIGIDLVEVERVKKSQEFLQKVALQSEIDYIFKSNCETLRNQRIAALFCVKEAVLKALGTGVSEGISLKEIELKHLESGKPYVEIKGKALEKFNQFYSGKTIEISLSHTKNYSTAIALII